MAKTWLRQDGEHSLKWTLRQRQILWAYLFLSVSLLFFIAIRWYPTLLAFNISFRDWNVFEGAGPLVGLANYADIWEDFQKPRSPIRSAFWNTLRYVILGVPLQLVLALSVALLLNRVRRLAGFYRAAYFVPFVTSAVAVAFVWNWIYAPQVGLLNQLLKMVGLPMQQFLRNPDLALPAITVVAVWRSIGFAIIIFLAGLQQIPDIYYEAAQIDGASRWHTFWRITLPLLNPVLVYLAVLQTIDFLRLFDLVLNMTNGGPLNSTTTVVLEVYNEGFGSYNMGYAAALTVILFFLILLITIFQLRVLSRRVEY